MATHPGFSYSVEVRQPFHNTNNHAVAVCDAATLSSKHPSFQPEPPTVLDASEAGPQTCSTGREM